MDECNLNFRAKQATMYQDGKQVFCLLDADFDQFIPLQAIIETACQKTPEQIVKEKAAAIASLEEQKKHIDDQIAAIREDTPITPIG